MSHSQWSLFSKLQGEKGHWDPGTAQFLCVGLCWPSIIPSPLFRHLNRFESKELFWKVGKIRKVRKRPWSLITALSSMFHAHFREKKAGDGFTKSGLLKKVQRLQGKPSCTFTIWLKLFPKIKDTRLPGAGPSN